ncbi:MAG: hypothetical protein IJT77_13415 [Clostridia bacterium]|nr:hypothetical protein [Clostridia bacterium]
MRAGLFFCFEAVVVLINLFYPVLFWFDETGAYHAGLARYITLAIQISLFLAAAVYTLYIAAGTKGSIRLRHMTIGLFGIAMTLLIACQVFYPLLPLYAIGYMLGTCLLHSFVVENEKRSIAGNLRKQPNGISSRKRSFTSTGKH